MDGTIARFRDGDPDAVRDVFRRYAGAVTTVARSIVRDPEIAADVVQQTFVKAWRAAATFEGDRELGPWLYAIARRTAIDALRAERRPTRGGHVEGVDVAELAADADAVLSFERTWEVHEVRRALDDLPAPEREVIRRSHLLGETHEEIAVAMGVPVGTVKSRSSRGHRRLVAALGHLIDSPASGANRAGSASVLPHEEAP